MYIISEIKKSTTYLPHKIENIIFLALIFGDGIKNITVQKNP